MDAILDQLLLEIQRATMARELAVYYSVRYINMKPTVKNEFENLARRNALKFIDAERTDDKTVYNAYFRDRDGWLYVWRVAFDDPQHPDHLTLAQEILVYDADNAPAAIPAAVVQDVHRLMQWHETMALDPARNPEYYDAVSNNRT